MWINNYFKYQILNPVFLSDVANITICFDISDSGCRGKFLKSREDRFLMKFYDYVTFSQHVQFFIKAMIAMSSLPDVRVLWKKNLSPASVPNFYYLLYLTRNLLSENLFFFFRVAFMSATFHASVRVDSANSLETEAFELLYATAVDGFIIRHHITSATDLCANTTFILLCAPISVCG